MRVAKSSALRTLVISIGGFAPLLLALLVAPGMVGSGQLTAGAALGALVYSATTMQPAVRGLAATVSAVVCGCWWRCGGSPRWRKSRCPWKDAPNRSMRR
jgi:hypothetical protein